jgi:hypothetical protein
MTGWSHTTLRQRGYFYAGFLAGCLAASVAWVAGALSVMR